MRAHPIHRRGRGLLAIAIGLLLFACMAGRDEDGAPRQGWWAERGPVVPHDTFPEDCSLCHQGGGWNDIRADFEYDHEAQTGLALLGAHADAECLRCHNDRGPVELFAQEGCAGCHLDVHFAKLGQDCAWCHDVELVDWRPRDSIVMHRRTRFPLVGAHAVTACWACHPGALIGVFLPADTECLTCHQDDIARALDPDHQVEGWISDCDRCHIPTTWGGSGFNHPWPLTGQHAQIDCSLCHVNGVFAGTPTDCWDCHMADYLGTQNPDHQAVNFPTTCFKCHSTSAWVPANFDHAGVSNGCDVCHQTDYDQTTDPDHLLSGFPTSCEICHNVAAWVPAPGYDHDDFPIDTGPHKVLACVDCHQVPTDFQVFTCISCHEHNQQDMDDDHSDVNNYVYNSPDCLACHPNGQESPGASPDGTRGGPERRPSRRPRRTSGTQLK